MHRLPHKPPVKFVDALLADNEFDARARVAFPTLPTLPMLVEAAAQTSVFVRVSEIKKSLGIPEDDTVQGMLLKMKADRLAEIEKTSFEISVEYRSNLDNFFVMDFTVYDGGKNVASGTIHTVIEKRGA